MELPSRAYDLTEDVRVRPKRVPAPEWQAHVLAHPFGLLALRGGTGPREGPRPWNHEAWDALTPPVLTEDARHRLVRTIRQLASGHDTCNVPELERTQTTAPPRGGRIECYDCAPLLAQACMDATEAVSLRYAAFLEDTLAELEGAAVIEQKHYSRALASTHHLRHDAAPVASVGRLRRSEGPGLRINRPDGVRIELYAAEGGFHWRTTYRNPIRSRDLRDRDLRARRSHLFDHLEPIASSPLSGRVLVPRLWWERRQP